MSAGADDEYFVDGMTEELISRLSRVKGLEVIARTSIASYKGTKKKIGEIASELNVGTVLEGSVRKANGKVRITAQLINATNEAHLWSEDYDRDLKDIFTVQTDIAQHVANALAVRLALAAPPLPHRSTCNGVQGDGNKESRGLQRVSQGTVLLQQGDCGGPAQGRSRTSRMPSGAIRRMPLAYAGLADTYGNLAGYEAATMEDVLQGESRQR